MESSIRTVGVAGAGTMGQGIALASSLAGYEVSLFDVNQEALISAIASIGSGLEQSVQKGRLSAEAAKNALSRIHQVDHVTRLKADLIIEAVIENLEIKQKLFAELEAVNSATSIFTSNTSSISISKIAAHLKSPGRFAGLHFFNPAHIMKLVEVISGQQTDARIASELKAFVKSLGKVAVEAKDSPGFIVNRVARHYYVESLKLIEDGVASHENIDQLMKATGFKMGPFELMDLIGIDVNYAVTESVYEGFNKAHKFMPSNVQLNKIKRGELGKKTGQGFYSYAK